MKFRYRKAKKTRQYKFIYKGNEESFSPPFSLNPTLFEFMINELQIGVDHWGKLVDISGWCPVGLHAKTNEFPKNIEFYELSTLTDEYQDGGIFRLNEDKRWPAYINSKEGWLCLGDPALEGFTAIEFLPGCVATLDGHELIALWIQPEDPSELPHVPEGLTHKIMFPLPPKKRIPKPKLNLYNPKYLLKMFGESFIENDAACLGSQLRELFDFLIPILPPHVWLGADIRSIWVDETLFMNDPYSDFFLQKIGSISDVYKQLRPIIQFESGVFCAVKKERLLEDHFLFDVHTEDPAFRPLEAGDILIEIRAYKTNHYAVYSEDHELIEKIATKFNCKINSL